MFDSKKFVLVAILGIVVAGSSNSVLIPQAWSQRPAPPTDLRLSGNVIVYSSNVFVANQDEFPRTIIEYVRQEFTGLARHFFSAGEYSVG